MDKPSLFEQQTTLGRYLRDPEHCAPPGEMYAARAQVYRDLIFANLSTLLSGTFPVLIKILGDEQWRALVRIFLRDYRARTPKFGEIAQEFVEFIAAQPPALNEGHGRRSWSSWRITSGSRWHCSSLMPSPCRRVMWR